MKTGRLDVYWAFIETECNVGFELTCLLLSPPVSWEGEGGFVVVWMSLVLLSPHLGGGFVNCVVVYTWGMPLVNV